MTINTKKVQGRRTVRYGSYDELLTDAGRLAECNARTLGNWSQGQIYEHLARSLDSSIDGAGFSMPAPLRAIMSLVLKRRFLKKGLPAGFKSPDRFVPEQTSIEAGLAALQEAVDRQGRQSQRAPHPAFGKISTQEWQDFNLRHAEMHMSFLVNGDDGR